MENITRGMLDFVMECDFVALPKALVHEVKRILLDSIGCALGEVSTDKGKFSIELARRLGGASESTILGAGDRTSCSSAAFANGELINALDMDAILYPPGHVSPFVIPAPLALAESVGASGKDLINAVGLAHELAQKIRRGFFRKDLRIVARYFRNLTFRRCWLDYYKLRGWD